MYELLGKSEKMLLLANETTEKRLCLPCSLWNIKRRGMEAEVGPPVLTAQPPNSETTSSPFHPSFLTCKIKQTCKGGATIRAYFTQLTAIRQTPSTGEVKMLKRLKTNEKPK